MDRAEAIKVLTLALMQCGMMMPIEWVRANGKGSEFDEAFQMAISAMKEQEQGEQGCEYCNGLPDEQREDFTMPNASKKDYDIVKIKFCPMCGRKLKEGAN